MVSLFFGIIRFCFRFDWEHAINRHTTIIFDADEIDDNGNDETRGMKHTNAVQLRNAIVGIFWRWITNPDRYHINHLLSHSVFTMGICVFGMTRISAHRQHTNAKEAHSNTNICSPRHVTPGFFFCETVFDCISCFPIAKFGSKIQKNMVNVWLSRWTKNKTCEANACNK